MDRGKAIAPGGEPVSDTITLGGDWASAPVDVPRNVYFSMLRALYQNGQISTAEWGVYLEQISGLRGWIEEKGGLSL